MGGFGRSGFAIQGRGNGAVTPFRRALKQRLKALVARSRQASWPARNPRRAGMSALHPSQVFREVVVVAAPRRCCCVAPEARTPWLRLSAPPTHDEVTAARTANVVADISVGSGASVKTRITRLSSIHLLRLPRRSNDDTFFSASRGAPEGRPQQGSGDIRNSRVASPGNIPFRTAATAAAGSEAQMFLQCPADTSDAGYRAGSSRSHS